MNSTIVDPAREAVSAIAMTITLLSFTMLFLALFLGYAILRANAPAWPGIGYESVHLFHPTLSSFLIVVSSLCYLRFERGGKKHWLYGTLALGCSFLLSQWMLWGNLKESGLSSGVGVFFSFLYGLTWIHGGHLFLALLLMSYLALRFEKIADFQGRVLWVRNVGKFWHFLGILWLVIYFLIFIL